MSRASRRKFSAGEGSEGMLSIPAALSNRVTQLIRVVRPSKSSQRRRNQVADYVRQLIANCFAPEHKVEAFMFGSVPLRTYLPDGDIDVSIFCEGKGLQDCWGERLQGCLEKEAENPKAAFQIANVQLINAEVKLLKCLVDNIVVDMSFNQIGGLCTLNFLEAMDRRIGDKHLFKRSVILIKAWCYYESRVLGAQYSLLSTYALETMVLYIFNVHHAVLQTPLEVLYKFLVVFHQFEWDRYCLTLSGPVLLKNLEQEPSMPPSEHGTLLSSFMNVMLNSYAYNPVVPTNTKGPAFPKFINIMDPLLHSNNLGRSVSKTSEIRIRNAFGYAAGKLSALFKKAEKDLAGALDDQDQFFKNTWNAHGRPRPSAGPTQQLISPLPAAAAPSEEQKTSQSPKEVGETASLGHPTAFPGFPGLHGLQLGTTPTSTYPPQPPPPPPTHRQVVGEDTARRNTGVSVLQVHPPQPPGVVQTVSGEAVIGTAVGHFEDRSALDVMTGVGLNSSGHHLPGFDQCGVFNPWIMAQPLWFPFTPCYPVQQPVTSQAVKELMKPSVAQSGKRDAFIPARQEIAKAPVRVRSEPDLRDIPLRRRQGNNTLGMFHPHPVPYFRKCHVITDSEPTVSAPASKATQPARARVSQAYPEKPGLILPTMAPRASSRRLQELYASVKLDDKVLAKLEKMELAKKKREKMALELAAHGGDNKEDNTMNEESPTAVPEESPDPASESPKDLQEKSSVQGTSSSHPQRKKNEHPNVYQAPGQIPDLSGLSEAELTNLLQMGNLMSSSNGQYVAANRQVLVDQQSGSGVDPNSSAEALHAPILYPGYYTPQLTHTQLMSLCGAIGLTQQLPSIQGNPYSNASRSPATTQNQIDLQNQAAIISGFFSGASFQSANPLPIAYVNARSATVNASGNVGNAGIAESQVGLALANQQYPLSSGCDAHQATSSWGYSYPATSLHAVQQRPDTESQVDAARDPEDVLAGDLDGLTKNLEVARNCVGRKSERGKSSLLNKLQSNSNRAQQRGEPHTAGQHKKRQQGDDANRAFGQHAARLHVGQDGRVRTDQYRERHAHLAPQGYQGDGISSNQVPANYGSMVYVGPSTQWAQPPPPPPSGAVDTQLAQFPTAEDVMYQLQANVNGAPHIDGYFVQSPTGAPLVAGTSVGTPGLVQAVPVNGISGLPSRAPTSRRDVHGNSQGHQSQWRSIDDTRDSKSNFVSTRDGTRVEIDPLVFQAVEAALAGTGISSENSLRVQGSGNTEAHQPPRRDDHHRNPPADAPSPRSIQSKSTDSSSGGSNQSNRTARKSSEISYLARPVENAQSLQNPPVVFGGVAPGSIEALTFLASGNQTLKANGIPAESSLQNHQGTSRTLLPPSQGSESNFPVGRSPQSYGTGGFIPLGAHMGDRQVLGTGNSGHVSTNGSDPPGSRFTPDADPQSVPDADHIDDGCWSSISAGSDRAEENRLARGSARRYGNRYPQRGTGSRTYQQDYGSRAQRHYRNQIQYWNHPEQWLCSERGSFPDIAEYYPEYGQQVYYPDARTHTYAGGYQGYVRSEQDFDANGYPSDQQRHLRSNFNSRKGSHEKDDPRWFACGQDEKNHNTDGSTTPDSQASHHTATRSHSRNFPKREPERWDGGKKFPKGGRRMDGYGFMKPRYDMESHIEGGHSFNNFRLHGDQIVDRRSVLQGYHRNNLRNLQDRDGRGHRHRDDLKLKPRTLPDEDFPALEAAQPHKQNVAILHSRSHRTAEPQGLNPYR